MSYLLSYQAPQLAWANQGNAKLSAKVQPLMNRTNPSIDATRCHRLLYLDKLCSIHTTSCSAFVHEYFLLLLSMYWSDTNPRPAQLRYLGGMQHVISNKITHRLNKQRFPARRGMQHVISNKITHRLNKQRFPARRREDGQASPRTSASADKSHYMVSVQSWSPRHV